VWTARQSVVGANLALDSRFEDVEFHVMLRLACSRPTHAGPDECRLDRS
jgi:hypothetical protein